MGPASCLALSRCSRADVLGRTSFMATFIPTHTAFPPGHGSGQKHTDMAPACLLQAGQALQSQGQGCLQFLSNVHCSTFPGSGCSSRQFPSWGTLRNLVAVGQTGQEAMCKPLSSTVYFSEKEKSPAPVFQVQRLQAGEMDCSVCVPIRGSSSPEMLETHRLPGSLPCMSQTHTSPQVLFHTPPTPGF